MERDIKPGITIQYDLRDTHLVSPYEWSLSRGYPARGSSKDGIKSSFYLHQEVWRAHNGDYDTSALLVDHKDSNKLNAQLSNLQLITHRENVQKVTHTASKYPGVSSRKSRGYQYWEASLYINKSQIYFGTTKSELHSFAKYKLACYVMGYPIVIPYTDLECYDALSIKDILNVFTKLLNAGIATQQLINMVAWVADRSNCRERSVGTVVFNGDMSQVLSVGFNGDGIECLPINDKCTCIHSEVVALARNNVCCEDNKIVLLSLSPCCDCAKSLVHSGVSYVLYTEQWKNTDGLKILDSFGITHKLLKA